MRDTDKRDEHPKGKVECWRCRGDGEYAGRTCPRCMGLGKIYPTVV